MTLLKNECSLSGWDTQILLAALENSNLYALSGGGEAKTSGASHCSGYYLQHLSFWDGGDTEPNNLVLMQLLHDKITGGGDTQHEH